MKTRRCWSWYLCGTLLALPLSEDRIAKSQEVPKPGAVEELIRQQDEASARALELSQDGKYDDAVDLQRKALRLAETIAAGKGDLRVAIALNNLALVLQSAGKLAEAVPYAKRAVGMNDQLVSVKDDAYLAGSLSTLAGLLTDLGRYREALPYSTSALEMSERLCKRLFPKPNDLFLLANCLDNRGVLLNAMGRPKDALPQAERATRTYEWILKTYEGIFGKGPHPHLARALCHEAVILKDLRRFAEALEADRRAMEMFEQLYPRKDDPEKAECLAERGVIFNHMNRYQEANEYLNQALAMYRRLFRGKDHPDLALCLRNVAITISDQGRSPEAVPLADEARAMFQRLYGDQNNPDMASALNTEGVILQRANELVRGLPFARSAKEMLERLHPDEDDAELADSLNDLASILRELGEAVIALPLAERSVTMSDHVYKDRDDPRWADSLSTLGAVLIDLRQPEKALPFMDRSVSIYLRLFPGQDDPHLARNLSNLGVLQSLLKRYGDARRNLEKAVAMRERLFPIPRYPNGHPDLAHSLHNLAFLLGLIKEYDPALSAARRAVAMYDRLYSNGDAVDLAMGFDNLGILLMETDHKPEATACFERSLGIYGRQVRELALSASAAEAFAFSASLPRTRDFLLFATQGVPGTEARAYAAVWRSKAMVSRALRARSVAASRARSEPVDQKRKELQKVRLRLNALLVQPVTAPADYAAMENELSGQKESLERQIADLLTKVEVPEARDPDEPGSLSRALPVRAVFLDFVRYNHVYDVFLLANGRAVRRVELPGTAEQIDQAVDNWRRAIAPPKDANALVPQENESPLVEADRLAAEMRRLVWAPVAALLPADTEAVYVCPDGNLARLPWAAIPGANAGTVLLEEYAIAVVPDGPFLLERLEAKPPEGMGGPVLAVGGVGYSRKPTTTSGQPAGAVPPVVELSNRPGEYFEPLGRSEPTARQVLALAAPRPTLALLSGAKASTDRVLLDLPRAGWALIYTHGYFDEKGLEDQKKRAAVQLEVWQFRLGQTTEPVGLGLRSPLAYNGLAFAGANLPAGDLPDGGILSAEAIAGLPLGGLRLTVLAACETGLGALTEGEGVRGLVHAFHIAGCPDVMATLWNVDDDAAAAVVKLLYQGVWRKGLSPLAALRRAQLLAYRNPDRISELAALKGEAFEAAAAGLEREGPAGRAPAKRWAAFSLSGAGR